MQIKQEPMEQHMSSSNAYQQSNSSCNKTETKQFEENDESFSRLKLSSPGGSSTSSSTSSASTTSNSSSGSLANCLGNQYKQNILLLDNNSNDNNVDLDVIDSADLFGNTVNQDEVMAVLTASNNQQQPNNSQQQYVLGGQQASQSGLFYNVTNK